MLARGVEIEMRERADLVLARRDRRRAEIDDRLGRELARLDAAREIEGGKLLADRAIEHGCHSCDDDMTRGRCEINLRGGAAMTSNWQPSGGPFS